jgi:hypothetical protein
MEPSHTCELEGKAPSTAHICELEGRDPSAAHLCELEGKTPSTAYIYELEGRAPFTAEPSLQVHNIRRGWSPPFKFTIYTVEGALPSSSQYTPWMVPSLQVQIYTP